MAYDWRHEGDMCRIRFGACSVKATAEYYQTLAKSNEDKVTEYSELEFWKGYYSLK